MKALLVILYVVAALAPVVGLSLAIASSRKVVQKNAATNARLLEIQDAGTAERGKHKFGSPEYEQTFEEGRKAMIAAGAKTFDEKPGIPNLEQLSFAPNFIENMILKRLTNRFPTEIALIMAGLICGAVASIWSLFI